MRKIIYLLLSLVFMFLWTGCATVSASFENTPDLLPPMTPLLAEAKRNAKVCASPEVAKLKLSSEFRYGCFCGKDHPRFELPRGVPSSELLPDERNAVLAKYMAINPIDDIDALCQKHDMCWIHKGRSDYACNEALYEGLKDLSNTFDARQKWLETDSVEWRCSILAGDMRSAFLTIFVKEESTEPGIEAGSAVGRFFVTPFLVGSMAVLRPRIWADKPYPLPHERCNL